MQKRKQEVEGLPSDQESNKKIAMWASEVLIIKLLIKCIVENYHICINNEDDSIKVWIENQSETDKLSPEAKKELIQELTRHIR